VADLAYAYAAPKASLICK